MQQLEAGTTLSYATVGDTVKLDNGKTLEVECKTLVTVKLSDNVWYSAKLPCEIVAYKEFTL